MSRASSFRQGLVHDTLLAAEVLLADGQVITFTPDNEHRDLFLALPNSYGTLGYALRLRLSVQPVQAFVRVEHRRFADPAPFFAALVQACRDEALDFVDGVVFAPCDLVLNAARFVAGPAQPSDYTFERMYWQSLRDTPVDHLSTHDWLWRWDTDWFWCSKQFGADRPWVRRLLGQQRLNSRTRWMRWNARWQLTQRIAAWRGITTEPVIQDVDLPEPEAPAFLRFLLREIGILPIWICPIGVADKSLLFTLYPLRPGMHYVNFGFWDVLQSRTPHARGHFNRLIEREVIDRGGIKSLYSDSCFTREEFDAAYAMDRYAVVKQRYDPQRRLPDLYEKCVLKR